MCVYSFVWCNSISQMYYHCPYLSISIRLSDRQTWEDTGQGSQESDTFEQQLDHFYDNIRFQLRYFTTKGLTYKFGLYDSWYPGHSRSFPVTRSLGHSVNQSLGHLVTQSFDHWSLQSLLRLLVTGEWPAEIWVTEVTKSDRGTKWPNNQVTEWPSDRVTEWQIDRVTEQRSDRVTERLEVTFEKLLSFFQSTFIHYMKEKGKNLKSENSTPITMA